MRFIKLTNIERRSVYFAVDKIHFIAPLVTGGAHIAIGGADDKDVYEVKESVEEIFARLKDTYRKDFPDE